MTKINFFSLIVLCLVLSLGQLQRININSGLSIYLHDLFVFSWVVINLWSIKDKILTKFKLNKNIIILFAFIILGWSLAFLKKDDLVRPLLYTLRLILYLVFGWILKWRTEEQKIDHDQINKNWVRFDLIVGGGLILLFGFVQYLIIPDTRFLAVFGWDDHYYRLISTLFDPAFTGLVLVITWILVLLTNLPKEKFWWNLEWLRNFSLVALLAGILLTFSRSSYLALGISAIYLFIFNQKLRKKIFCLTLLAMMGFVLLPKPSGEGGNLGRSSTILARKGNIRENLPQIKSVEFFIGQGLFVSQKPDVYEFATVVPNHARIPDNSLLFLIQGVGVVGAAYLLIQLIKLGRWAHITDRTLAACLVALVVHSQFNASLVQPFILLWMVMIAASAPITKSKT